MSRSEELVIWMSSTAMKAPSMPAATAIQVRASMRAPLAGAPGGAWCCAIGLVEVAIGVSLLGRAVVLRRVLAQVDLDLGRHARHQAARVFLQFVRGEGDLDRH